jgi:hypothetical protein
MLFHSIEELKCFISGSIDNDQSFLESILSDIRDAAYQHIAPKIGDILLEELSNDYPDIDPDSMNGKLLTKVQSALAPLSLYHASRTKVIRFGNHGFSKSDSSAYRYQETEYRAAMLESGYEHIERLLKFLEVNHEAFGEKWEFKDAHFNRLLRYAVDFRGLVGYRIDRITFETLLPFIDEAESSLERRLSVQFFAHLKGPLNTTPEKKVQLIVKKMIGQLAVTEALRRQSVQFVQGKIVQTEYLGEQATSNMRTANPSATEMAHHWESVAFQRQWEQLSGLLRDVGSFPLLYHTGVGGLNPDDDAWGYEPPVEPRPPKKNKKVVRI